MIEHTSSYSRLLKDRINLRQIPFSERGSRLTVFFENQHFSIRLAERWIMKSNDLSAYRNRPPLIDRFALTDASGNALPMKVTTYPESIEIETPLGYFSLAFLDSETLYLVLPPARFGITIRALLDRAQTDRRGGILRMTGDIRRNFAYTTNARIIKDEIFAEDTCREIHLIIDATAGNKGFLLNITPRLGFNRWIPEPGVVMEEATKRWHTWFTATPPVLERYQEQYYYAWWLMRAGLLSTRYYTTREVMAPSMTHYVGSWQWDNYFHALAYRHVEPNLAKDQLRILLDHQREDGMIPDAVHDEGTVTHLDYPVDADVTKPPLIAWAAWKLFEQDGDLEFLDEIYAPMLRWNDWWFEKNDLDHNGLCEYQHPFSSGLDDNPLWDNGMPVESPDLNTYLCMQQEALAKIAILIGEHKDAALWTKRADAMARRMIRLRWDEKAGIFWAIHQRKRIPVLTPFNLYPLITGRMPREIANQLVSHITDPNEFWSRFPLPTVAMNDPKFDPQQMWRGPTWANINYLFIEGLLKSGFDGQARELRQRTLDLLSSQKDFYEYYDPQSGENPPKAASIFGWSAALFIDLVIQETRSETEGPSDAG
jgi:Mannosylglycerate hydrolase MGH1-like glycoside hydrolase domain